MTAVSPWQRVNKRKLFERFAIEIGPALVFVFSLQAMGLKAATLAFIAATAVAACYSWFEKRRIPYIPFGMVLLAALFGGLTIIMGDPSYITFRATLVNASGALAILVGLVFGRLVLKNSLQDGFKLPDGAWWTLSIRMVLFLVIMAGLNEFFRLSFSTEVWAWFKAATPLGNVVFLALNWNLIRKNITAEESELTDSPPLGPKSSVNPAAKPA